MEPRPRVLVTSLRQLLKSPAISCMKTESTRSFDSLKKKKKILLGLPWGSSDEDCTSNAGGIGLIPGLGN